MNALNSEHKCNGKCVAHSAGHRIHKNRNETTNRMANKTSISNNDVINRMTEQNRFNLRTIRFGVEERREEFERRKKKNCVYI